MTKEEKNYAMFCHLASLAGFIGVPFGNIIGPLIVWLMKKEDSPFVDACGKEALNFQISVTIYSLVSAILIYFCIGIFMLLAVVILDLVCTIQAAMRANEGAIYRYPMSIRFIH